MQLFICIAIVSLKTDQDFSGVWASVIMNRLVLGMIILSVINWITGRNIGYSSYIDDDENKQFYYSQEDRNIAKIPAIGSTILFFATVISLVVSAFDFF